MEQFLLEDRIAKIRSINEQYDLEHNAYLSFSGGKDSTVLHYLLDEALPNNNIPRVYFNTGIEYFDILRFVKDLASKDSRIKIVNSGVNIKTVLKENGYPFKNKEHSQKLSRFQKNGMRPYLADYAEGRKGTFSCPEKLRYQFKDSFNLKVSDKCCFFLKKKVADKWSKENGKGIKITGMRKEEKGLRTHLNCILLDSKGSIKAFHPLSVINEDWENWYIQQRDIRLARLYYEPFNFKRTGCKGCPFSADLQKQLDVMEQLLPAERKQCEIIWKPVYDEYRRIGYRLKHLEQLNDSNKKE